MFDENDCAAIKCIGVTKKKKGGDSKKKFFFVKNGGLPFLCYETNE
jgi:hypothetical protein